MTQTTHSPTSLARRILARGTHATRALVVVIAAGAMVLPGVSGASRGWGGHRDPERIKAHVAMAADWALYKVDASDAQKAQVNAILERTIDELAGLHQDHAAMRDQVKSLLTAETIDRDAIERLRQEQLARFDTASARIAIAIADVAEVLTPAQRVELAELAESFHGHHGHD